MDVDFISNYNIDNIFNTINSFIVQNHNFNLSNNKKYKKIIKKLSKTVYVSLNNSNNEKKNTLLVNDFNDIVLEKSVPFLLKEISKDKLNISAPQEKSEIGSKKSQPVGTTSSSSNFIQPIINSKPKKPRKKHKHKNDIKDKMTIFDSVINEQENDNKNQYEQFLKNQQDHAKQIKDANKKIKNNFRSLVKNKTTDKDIFGKHKKSDINAFEKIIEKKLVEKKPEVDREAYKSAIDLSIEGYDKAKINETLTRVMINQKDYSQNDKLESYEGEKYVGNLIKPIGDQAPIQPLLYQNTGKGSERLIKKTFVIDSGNVGGANTLSSVSNLGSTNTWTKFKVSMIDTFKIDKLCDLYLRSVSIFNPKIILNNVTADVTSGANSGMCFTIDIDELNIIYNSNNENLKDKIVLHNNISENATTQRYLNINYPTQAYYISSINPSKLSALTFTLGDQEGITNGIFNSNNNSNRIIFSFEIVLRGEVNELF